VSRAGHTVVDVDAHYLEPLTDLAEYMDEPWKSQVQSAGAQRFVPSGLGDRSVAGRIRRDDVPYNVPSAGNSTGTMTPDQMGAVQRRLGIDASIIVSNGVLRLADSTLRSGAVAFYNAYIDYMLERVADADAGLYTMPMLPWQDPEAAAAIVDRVGDHPAVVGACFATSGANPPLGDERYHGVYAAAERHDLPVVYHGTPGLPFLAGAFYADGLQKLIEGHSLGFAVSNQIQMTSVLLNGIPEQFPKLRFVFQESGVFWAPALMYRLDEYFLKRRSEAPLLKALPSEYVRDRFYFGTQPIESPKNPRHLRAVMEMIGIDHFLYASDYPHFDYDDPMAILKLGVLSADEKAAILGGNAIEVFNLRAGGPRAWQSDTSSHAQANSKIEVA
jgi:predicted TIM-barrel fold metal-dependent hydrolase